MPEKQAKSCGHQVSDTYKSRAQLTTYFTKADQNMMPASKIKRIYGLRWQIELIFKICPPAGRAGKSQTKIDKVKEMKIYRFECQLIAKLIWSIAHMKIGNYLTQLINKQLPGKTLSLWKYFKHAYRVNYLIRQIITTPDMLVLMLQNLIKFAQQSLLLESKKEIPSHYEVLINLT